MDRTENRPLAVDNTVHGHVGYPSLATPSSTIRVGKKRPAININSGADSHRRWLSITDVLSPLVSLTIVCRRWWWWWWRETGRSRKKSKERIEAHAVGAHVRTSISSWRDFGDKRNSFSKKLCDQRWMPTNPKLFLLQDAAASFARKKNMSATRFIIGWAIGFSRENSMLFSKQTALILPDQWDKVARSESYVTLQISCPIAGFTWNESFNLHWLFSCLLGSKQQKQLRMGLNRYCRRRIVFPEWLIRNS